MCAKNPFYKLFTIPLRHHSPPPVLQLAAFPDRFTQNLPSAPNCLATWIPPARPLKMSAPVQDPGLLPTRASEHQERMHPFALLCSSVLVPTSRPPVKPHSLRYIATCLERQNTKSDQISRKISKNLLDRRSLLRYAKVFSEDRPSGRDARPGRGLRKREMNAHPSSQRASRSAQESPRIQAALR
jgi:hypothetical protein